ncbi:MAG: hypothetical protein ACOYB1_20600 [Limnohabitans sp.]
MQLIFDTRLGFDFDRLTTISSTLHNIKGLIALFLTRFNENFESFVIDFAGCHGSSCELMKMGLPEFLPINSAEETHRNNTPNGVFKLQICKLI